jgi:hypothetical protein
MTFCSLQPQVCCAPERNREHFPHLLYRDRADGILARGFVRRRELYLLPRHRDCLVHRDATVLAVSWP